jgi:CheY-like chemotaxis protein
MTQKAREIYPGLPVILITGYDLEDIEQELAKLNVVDTFTKPLDAEDFLTGVYRALEQLPKTWPIDSQEATNLNYPSIPPGIRKRLEALSDDTGAKYVVLANVTGEILFNTGGESNQEIRELIAASAFSIDSSFHLSDRLGASEPQTIQFLVGQEIDLYCANIDRQHFLAIFFDAMARRGRIGTVWVFTRRAIEDLRQRLAEPISSAKQDLSTAEWPEETPLGQQSQIPGDQRTEVVEVPDVPQPEANAVATAVAKTRSPDPVTQATEPEGDLTMTGQLVAMEKLLDDVLSEASATRQKDLDLDAYWEEALLRDSYGDFVTPGISLEEARNMGLLDKEFSAEEE